MTPDEEQARRVARSEFVTRLFVVSFAVLVVIAVATIGLVRVTQTHNTAKTDKAAQTLAVIKDCTQPSGACYERGQEQTAGILASAQKIIIYSAACAVTVDTTETVDQRIAAISACVTKRLTARH